MKCVACNKECDELVKDGPFSVCKACIDNHYDAMHDDDQAFQAMVDYHAERQELVECKT